MKRRNYTPVTAKISREDPDTGIEREIVVSGNCHPLVPAVYFLRNGDPGWPEEPACIEDLEAYDAITREEVELTEKEVEEAEEALFEAARNAEEPIP